MWLIYTCLLLRNMYISLLFLCHTFAIFHKRKRGVIKIHFFTTLIKPNFYMIVCNEVAARVADQKAGDKGGRVGILF